MTNMQLLEAIGMLDEQTVLDAEQPIAKVLPTPRARLMRQIAAVAACVCLLFGGALVLQTGGWQTKAEAPAEPGAVNDASPTYASAAGTMTGDGLTGEEVDGSTAAVAEATTTAATYTTTTAAWTTTTYGHTTTRPATGTTTAEHTTVDGTSISTTGAPGEPGTEAGPPAWPIYTADLNGIPNTQDSEQALQTVGLQRLAVLEQEGDATFAVRDGRLYFKQSCDESRFVLIALGGDYMESAVDSGYTMQYELEYVGASADAFAAVITDMTEDGEGLRRFALRADGSTVCDTVCDGIRKPVYETDAGKLSGIGTDLTGVRLTVRVQWRPDRGHSVYVKTADMIGFVEVGTSLGGTHTASDGFAIGLSLCGAVEGYLDNIRLWLGYADEPSNAGIHYAPYTKAPQ